MSNPYQPKKTPDYRTLKQKIRKLPKNPYDAGPAKRLLHELRFVSELIASKPEWCRNLLDEASKSTCDEPRERIVNQ